MNPLAKFRAWTAWQEANPRAALNQSLEVAIRVGVVLCVVWTVTLLLYLYGIFMRLTH